MEIVLLVLSILIFGKITKQVDKIEVKFIAGSIFGIAYFFIWPYVFYYTQLLNWPETSIQISFLVLVTVSLLFARALIQFKFYEVLQLFSVGLFFIFFSITSIYDIQIKDTIAANAGYFSGKLSSKSQIADVLTEEIHSPNNAYSLFIPGHWKEHKHTGTNLPFYRPTYTADTVIEFRPRCNNKQNLSISEIVTGISRVHQEKDTSVHQCFHWNEHDYACRVIISNEAGIKRIRWLGANKATNHLFELDFVTQNSSTENLKLIDSIFKSIKFNEPSKNTANCVTPIEWL